MRLIILASLLLCSGVDSFTSPRWIVRSTVSSSTARHAAGSGTFRPFVEHAWSKLEESGLLLPSDNTLVPSELACNEAVAKGMPDGSIVKISVDAKMGKDPVKYGRFALLETLLPDQDVTTKGIQVMNLVVFSKPPLPVWGVDLVSLPGDKHLLAMDVQPMVEGSPLPLESKWKDWHEKYVQGTFEWGGDIPEAAQKFFSPQALWTRLAGEEAVELIQTKVFDAFVAHLDLYLECVASAPETTTTENHQEEYLEYRLQNDPARPMLKRLYGPEWTEQVLDEVLFPKDRVL